MYIAVCPDGQFNRLIDFLFFMCIIPKAVIIYNGIFRETIPR